MIELYSSSDLNKIKNNESRKNFEFVLQSYYSKNNKATILLLYNLVVNDLYGKLVLMNDNGYVNCKNELGDIENNLKDNDEAKYSKVEEKIFSVYKIKNILNHSTIDLLEYFKKIRNKCAHPFFFKENDYTPSDEEVYLFITKIYNDILIVEAFFKNPYDVMKNDIELFKFPDLEGVLLGISKTTEDVDKVEKYFTKKYYKCMTDNNYIKLFKSFVDLSITKNTEEILMNQYKHYLLLRSLLNYLKKVGKLSILNNTYEWNKLKLENIYDDTYKKLDEQLCFSLSYLFRTLEFNYSFLEELKDENEDVFEYVYKSLYSKAYLFAEFWNLFDTDIDIAIEKLSNNLTYSEYFLLVKRLTGIVSKKNLNMLICNLLNKIPNFDGYNQADETLDLLLKIIEQNPKFNQEDVELFFEIMNTNRQIYDKSRSNRNRQFTKFTNLGFNLNKYENLKVEVDD